MRLENRMCTRSSNSPVGSLVETRGCSTIKSDTPTYRAPEIPVPAFSTAQRKATSRTMDQSHQEGSARGWNWTEFSNWQAEMTTPPTYENAQSLGWDTDTAPPSGNTHTQAPRETFRWTTVPKASSQVYCPWCLCRQMGLQLQWSSDQLVVERPLGRNGKSLSQHFSSHKSRASSISDPDTTKESCLMTCPSATCPGKLKYISPTGMKRVTFTVAMGTCLSLRKHPKSSQLIVSLS